MIQTIGCVAPQAQLGDGELGLAVVSVRGPACAPRDWRGEVMQETPPGSHYGLVLQKIRLLDPSCRREYPPRRN